MAIPKDINNLIKDSYKESSSVAGQPGLVVLNPDGSSIGAGGGGAATIADAADVAQGAIGDASVTAGATGTISAKLRRISADIATIIGHVDGIEALLTAIDGNAGAAADAAATAGGTGTIAAKLRAISRDIIANIVLAAGSNLIGKVDHAVTGIGHGTKTVTTAGTDVALAASTAAKKVIIQAYRANTGNICVGGSGVDAADSNGTGVSLDAGDSVTLEIDNLADVFIDATVNAEGVRYTYFT